MRRLTEEKINVIKNLRKRGVPISTISKSFGITDYTVYYHTDENFRNECLLRDRCKAFRNLVKNTDNENLFSAVRSYMDKKGY